MNTDRRSWEPVTERVIGAAMEVSNVLGAGFLEKVYERALFVELRNQGLRVSSQAEIPVHYKGESVGVYIADLIVENTVLIELKCARKLAPEHMAQCLNYLRASDLQICLLMNFGNPRLEWRRVLAR